MSTDPWKLYEEVTAEVSRGAASRYAMLEQMLVRDPANKIF
jgi:hypothetical protein